MTGLAAAAAGGAADGDAEPERDADADADAALSGLEGDDGAGARLDGEVFPLVRAGWSPAGAGDDASDMAARPRGARYYSVLAGTFGAVRTRKLAHFSSYLGWWRKSDEGGWVHILYCTAVEGRQGVV